jgi:hypothetical protein
MESKLPIDEYPATDDMGGGPGENVQDLMIFVVSTAHSHLRTRHQWRAIKHMHRMCWLEGF